MKRKWLLIPALLAAAAMVMISCPSDPDPIERSDPVDADWILEDGRVTIPVTLASAITNGTDYEIILHLIAVDDPLLGCHFKGQLFYVSGQTAYLVAEEQNAFPNVVAKEPRKYRWTFKAGDFGSEAQTAAVEGDYDLWDKTAIPASTPLEFRLKAMTPGWKEFGKDGEKWTFQSSSSTREQTEEVDYGKSGIKAGIEAGTSGTDGVTFRVKPVVSYTVGDTITGKGGSDSAPNGKGNIETTEFEKLKEEEAQHPGSILRFDCTVNVGTADTSSEKKAGLPGWGFGGVGNNMKQVRGQNPVLTLLIPDNASPGSQSIILDILIEDILLASYNDPYWTLVNLNETDTSLIMVNSMKIYTPTP